MAIFIHKAGKRIASVCCFLCTASENEHLSAISPSPSDWRLIPTVCGHMSCEVKTRTILNRWSYIIHKFNFQLTKLIPFHFMGYVLCKVFGYSDITLTIEIFKTIANRNCDWNYNVIKRFTYLFYPSMVVSGIFGGRITLQVCLC